MAAADESLSVNEKVKACEVDVSVAPAEGAESETTGALESVPVDVIEDEKAAALEPTAKLIAEAVAAAVALIVYWNVCD